MGVEHRTAPHECVDGAGGVKMVSWERGPHPAVKETWRGTDLREHLHTGVRKGRTEARAGISDRYRVTIRMHICGF